MKSPLLLGADHPAGGQQWQHPPPWLLKGKRYSLNFWVFKIFLSDADLFICIIAHLSFFVWGLSLYISSFVLFKFGSSFLNVW